MTVPVALTIAGSDSGGGAGLQADLRTFEAHGVYGTCAVSVVTAQNTVGVRSAHVLPASLVAAQLDAVLDDFPVRAVKTGALGSADVIRAVAHVLRGRNLPLVVDPVLASTGGQVLLDPAARQTLIDDLFPLATVVTPNWPEAQALYGGAWPEALPRLLKGGHGSGMIVTDDLRAGRVQAQFHAPRLGTRHTHGTGCTLAAAITANLALGWPLPEAVARAHRYLQEALRCAPGLGTGHGPLGFRVCADQD